MKSIHNKNYRLLADWLVSRRLLIGYTQAQLAEKLNRPQSFVSKYEIRERRLDLLEFLEICKALEANPQELIDKILNKGLNE